MEGAMTEPDEALTAQEQALIKRVDELIAVHGGDLRAVIEALLMAYDDRTEQCPQRLRRRSSTWMIPTRRVGR